MLNSDSYPGADDVAPNDYMMYCVVSWQTITNKAAPQGATSSFQAVLFPSGNIVFRFDEIGAGVEGNGDITIGLNKGNGEDAVTPYDTGQQELPISNGDSVAFIYHPPTGMYWYERSDTETWLAVKDISEKLNMSDDQTVTRSLYVDFPYSSSLETTYDSVRIGSNGGVRFGESGEIGSDNQDLPWEDETSEKGHPHLAVLWDDFDPGLGEEEDVYFRQNPAGPQPVYVTWYQLAHAGEPETSSTFQAIIIPSGDVIYHYAEIEDPATYGVTVGINDPRDPDEPQDAYTHHTTYHRQYGTIASPEIEPDTTHYYFLNERSWSGSGGGP